LNRSEQLLRKFESLSKSEFDRVVTELIMFIHDKGHCSNYPKVLEFIKSNSVKIDASLYRGTRSTDSMHSILSYSENKNIAEAMREKPSGKVVELSSGKGFPLYKFLLDELTKDELRDIKSILNKEREWLVVND